MNTEGVRAKPRYGHILAVFGLFLSLLTLTFLSVNDPRTIAFGTSEIASMSNQYRRQAGLADLTYNETLTSSAQAKAEDMATKSYFAHETPDGKTPWDFFDAAGYSYTAAGENLALSNQSATSVVDGWFNSPGHKANMLSSSYTEVGYGIAFVPHFSYGDVNYSNVYLVAAHYALPPTQAPSAAIQSTESPPPSVASPTAPTATPTAPVTQEQPATTTPPIVSEQTTEPSKQNSGTIAIATPNQPRLPVVVAYIGLGLGLVLVLCGVFIELRRFHRHLPLVPGLHS